MTSDGEERPDGAVALRPYGFGSVLRALVATLVVVWIVSFLYGLADHYSPLVYLNILLAVIMGWVAGVVASNGLRRQRINRAGTATLVGLVVGIFTLWVSWLAYFWVITGYDFSKYTSFAASPAILLDVIGYLAENPVWSIGKKGDGPWLYWVAWTLEAAILVLTPIKLCREFIRDNVLCPECNAWAADNGKVALFKTPAEDTEALFAAFKAGDLTPFRNLQRDTEGSPDSIHVVNSACPNCPHLESYVTVKRIVVTRKKDKEEKKETVLANHMPVDEELEAFLFSVPVEPPADAATTEAEQAEAPVEPPAAGGDE